VKRPVPEDSPAPSLSAERRAAFADDLLRFQLEELNGLGDRLAHADATGDGEGLAQARARCRLLLDALRWDAGLLARVLEVAERLPELPEDLFAPSLVVAALDPDGQASNALTASASEAVRRRLALAGDFTLGGKA
jgi:hypothetical protein